MKFLKQCYIELDNLKYSEENIAELFSILKRIIRFLESNNPDRLKNHALHFVLLTKEREFERFKYKGRKNKQEDDFNSARTNLMSDLRKDCGEYWDPKKDPWFNAR